MMTCGSAGSAKTRRMRSVSMPTKLEVVALRK